MSTFATSTLVSATSITCGLIGTTDCSILTPNSLEIYANPGIYNTSYTRNAITSTDPFDIDAAGLTFGGLAGSAGNLLLSAGADVIPKWLANAASSSYYLVGGATPAWSLIPTPSPSYTIYRGRISSTSTISGGQLFGATLAAIPAMTISCDMGTGSTLIVPVGIVGFTGSVGAYTGFIWITGQIGVVNLFWTATVV